MKYPPIKFLTPQELIDELDDPNHPDHDIIDISLDPPYCNMTKDELKEVRMKEEEVEVLKPDEMSDQEMADLCEEETNKQIRLIKDILTNSKNKKG
tara:strand:- start:1682 stop:1969 length:288 start_codon:yes stop_codon:yes gene_type:complete